MRLFWHLLLLFAVFLISSCTSNPDTYRLSLTAVPSEAGTVTPEDGDFTINRSLEISATPNEHWVFERWEGDHEGTGNPVIIDMDSDKDIAAIFAKRDYPLNITIEGEGTVTEQIVQQKATDYPHGTVVELTAEADSNWEFLEWRGDIESDENPVTVTIDGETDVIAVFERIEYPLTINIVGEGSVSEEIVQAKATDYPIGTVVELTAEPDSGWAFLEWEGDIESTENPVEITIDEQKTVTVTFDRTFRLTTLTMPEEGGTVEPSGGDYIRDTSFDVEAIPNEGWEFVEWRGDFTGTTNPFNLTMNGNKTLEARFEPLLFSLDLETSPENGGQILTSILSGDTEDDQYEFGSVVELTAVPEDDWQFVRWEGDVSSTANPATITINTNKSVRAVFRFFDGGSGTIGNPYQISTPVQLQAMKEYPDSYFILTQDIGADETSGWNEGDGFEPIGDDSAPFTGGFNGAGYEVSNLFINRSEEENVGFFGYIAEGALIQNITLTDTDITGSGNVGALAGYNDGEILNSSSTGTVDGDTSTGGLVGENDGSVQESYSTADVTGTTIVGGLIGINRSDVSKSYARGSVSATDNAGGLAGENAAGGLISESYASGNVTAIFTAGGVAGVNNSTVETGYWDMQSTTQADGAGDGETSDGMTGLTTAEMTGPDAETNMPDFDWEGTWMINELSYPVLQWQDE